VTDEQKKRINQDEEVTPEALEKLIPDKHLRESFFHMIEHLALDRAALTVLKGHLVIEEKITAAIETFVFHPELLDDSRLTFAHKLVLARSMSLDEDNNSMWDLISKLNTLRNRLAHSLKGEPRARAMTAVRDAYTRERGGKLEDWENDDELLLLGVLSMCLGFLDSFEQEVERFKDYVNHIDRVINPHRHRTEPPKSREE
jgi:hypothetical protein